MPVVELTMEQQFRMAQIEAALKKPEVSKDDLITVFVALQHQNMVLGNNIKQLLNQWPTSPQAITPEDQLRSGTL
jgi:hypothetical protein